MSAQRLSDRTLRRVARHTGITDLKYGFAHGDHLYYLITYGHVHYCYNMKTQTAELEWRSGTGGFVHYTCCPGGRNDDGVWTKSRSPLKETR